MGISKPFRFSYINAKCRALKADIFSMPFLKELISSKNIADIYGRLKHTPYGKSIEEPNFSSIQEGITKSFDALYARLTAKLSRKEKNIFDLFFYKKNELFDKKIKFEGEKSIGSLKKIDTEFIELVCQTLKELKKVDRNDLQKILGSYFDNMNLYTVFRLRTIYNAPREDILPFLYPYGLNFNIKSLNKLLDLTTIDQFNDTLKDIYKIEFNDISSFRQVLYKRHYKILNSIWLGYPFKISILFALLRQKEIEVQNINSIIEGIKYDQPQQDIQRMIIGVN